MKGEDVRVNDQAQWQAQDTPPADDVALERAAARRQVGLDGADDQSGTGYGIAGYPYAFLLRWRSRS